MFLSRREGSRELAIVSTATEEAMRYLEKSIVRWLKRHAPSQPDQRKNIRSEVVMTFRDRDVDGDDPIQEMLNALNGGLDILPQRVGERLTRLAQKKVISSSSLDEEIERAQDTGRATSLDVESVKRHHRQLRQESLERDFSAVGTTDPKIQRYIDARLEGKNQREGAAACGVTTRTARNYEKTIRLLLSKRR